jgi:DNA-binding CsgD family transcriptional regulator
VAAQVRRNRFGFRVLPSLDLVDDHGTGQRDNRVMASIGPHAAETTMAFDGLIGRRREVGELEAFLDEARRRARLVSIEGDAGIGKTRLWRHGLELAHQHGFRCLVARPASTELGLAFGGLADLLRDVDDAVLAMRPDPQWRALSVALLRAEKEETAPDELAVGAALLGVIRWLASRTPLFVGIDDIQWLDAGSARALEYALRRLDTERVAVLVTCRTGIESAGTRVAFAVDPERRIGLELEPLSLGAVHELVRSRLDVKLGRSTLQRVHETSAGNPLYALQLVQALLEVGAEVPPGQPLPVPADLRKLIAARLARLPHRARETLLVCALSIRPTVSGVQAAVADPRFVLADLEEARSAGIVDVADGEIRFAHPLLASVHASSFPAHLRRPLHRRLAELASGREERARHLALAADGPDDTVAAELDAAAAEARRRGALRGEAELLAQAVALTPAPDRSGRLRRRMLAARAELTSGEPDRARALLEAALEDATPGPERAEVLHGIGTLLLTQDVRRSAEVLQDAAREAGADRGLRARILCSLGKFVYGHWVGYEQTEGLAREAADLAEAEGDWATQALALALLGHSVFVRGGGLRADVMDRAIALEEAAGGASTMGEDSSPAVIYAEMLIDAELHDLARDILERIVARSRAAGEAGLAYPLHVLALLEFDMGRWDRARSLATEALDVAALTGHETLEVLAASVLGMVEGALGQVSSARGRLEAALALATRTGRGGRAPRYGLGLIELSVGDDRAAWRWLEPAIELILPLGLIEPSQQVVDGAEALARLGRLDESERLLAAFEEPARRLGRKWAAAAAARCRGIIVCARGDLATAEVLLAEGVEIGRRASRPFEVGRTLLELGSVRRRLGRKRAARATLQEAVDVLAGLGAERWAARARREAGRIGGRTATMHELTATETEIARLVGVGRTNKEIAAALHLSVKTVEWNLTRLYRKLGVGSRTELAIGRQPDGKVRG